MKSLSIALGLMLVAGAASAQQYTISLVAGIPQVQGYYGDGGPASSGQLDYPRRVAVDSNGNVFIADYSNFVIREVSGGNINTVAGTGTNCANPLGNFSCDLGNNGPATLGTMSYIQGIAVNSQGTNVYIADTYNAQVRVFNPGGNINLLAGTGVQGYAGDGGPAVKAELSQPAGVAVDGSGNVYIADYGNSTIRKVDTKGNISTVAGTGVWGYSGDGGPANKAMLAAPVAIAVDPAGNIFISDVGNNNIREITTDGNIHTLFSGVTAQSIAVDAGENIYFPSYITNTVQKILPNGTQFTIAGITGNPGYNPNATGGPATAAQLNQPYGVALDKSGNVYVADSNNALIWELTPGDSGINVSNAASGNGSAIAPGEIVALYGTGLGPATLVSATPSNGLYPTQLSGTTVSINGVNAPLIYTSATQVAAVVPFGTPVGGTVDIIVTYQGQQAVQSSVPVVASVPGLFTSNATGAGQAAAVNQNGTINSPTAPAPVGSVISIYLTGAGQTNPASVDGALATSPYPYPVSGAYVTISGQPAPITYGGAAPGEINGLVQINVQIPANLISIPVSGPIQVPVAVVVGGYTITQPNVTISVSQQ